MKKVIVILSAALVMVLLALYIDSMNNAALNDAGANGSGDGLDTALANEMAQVAESFQKIRVMMNAIILSMILYFLVLLAGFFLIVRKRRTKMQHAAAPEKQLPQPEYEDTDTIGRPMLSAAVKADDFIIWECAMPEMQEELPSPQDDSPTNPLNEAELDCEPDTATGSFFAEAIRHVTGADIAFINSGGIRSPLDPEHITEGDMMRAFPFDDTVMVQGLTEAQITAVLEHSVGMGSEQDGRHLHVSGIAVEVDVSMPAGARVISITLPDGAPLNRESEYIVAANDYIAKGGDGYDILAELPKMSEGQTVVQAVLEYIAETGTPVLCKPEKQEMASAQR